MSAKAIVKVNGQPVKVETLAESLRNLSSLADDLDRDYDRSWRVIEQAANLGRRLAGAMAGKVGAR